MHIRINRKTLFTAAMWLAAVGIMILIFRFSSETGGESSNTSGGLTGRILSLFWTDFRTMDAERQNEIIESLAVVVRKGAHFTIYASLGFFLRLGNENISLTGRTKFVISSVIGALYAASDEIHQYFVPDRACMLIDVIIDTCGVMTGAAVAILLLTVVSKKRCHKSA